MDNFTRRDVLKAGGLLTLSPIFSTTVSATDSGYVELTTDAIVPTDTSLIIRIYEDTTGDGNVNKQQEKEIEDGNNTYEYDALDGYSGQGYEYWISVSMVSNSDNSSTPELNSAIIELPDETPEDSEDDLEIWEDNFEDVNYDGWVTESPDVSVENEGISGSYSLYNETNEGDRDEMGLTWTAGPSLDMREGFEIHGISKHNDLDKNDNSYHVRYGIAEDLDSPDVNALLQFNGESNKTFLSTDSDANASDATQTIDNAFMDEWIEWELYSDEGSDKLNAKVWLYDETEPENPQLTTTFEGVAGEFVIQTGTDRDTVRQVYLDEILIEGYEYFPDDENLLLDCRTFVERDSSIPYAIYTWENGDRVEITNDATIESNNPNLLSVDTENNEINGLDNSGVTEIIVSYDNGTEVLETYKEISVGNVSIDDIDILPPSKKIEAVFTDKTSQVIFGATFAALFVKKLIKSHGNSDNAWISLGTAFSVIMLAGFQGWISNGIVFAALFFVIIASIVISNVRQNEVSIVNQE